MGRVKKVKVEPKIPKLKTVFKKTAVKVRDRRANPSEKKLSCPICGLSNRTYRVLVSHCKDDHPGMQLAITCLRMKCNWYCCFSIMCWQHHMLYEHEHKIDVNDDILLVDVKGDFTDHSAKCFRTMGKRKIKHQPALTLKIEMDFCRRGAKKFIAEAYKMGRLTLPEVLKAFPEEDHEFIGELFDHETYVTLVKRYPYPDHMILKSFLSALNPDPNLWKRNLVENIASYIYIDRAEDRAEAKAAEMS